MLDIGSDSDEPFGALIAYQYAVSAQITKEAKNSFPAIEEALAKIAAKHIRSRQNANAAREEAEMHLTLREIAAGLRKYCWDRMFQDSVLRHLSEQLSNSPSHGLYKLNKAVNELQALVAKGKQVPRRGFYSRIHDAFSAPELTITQEPPQAAMAATTSSRPQGPNRKENVNPQQPAHYTKPDPDIIKFMKDVK